MMKGEIHIKAKEQHKKQRGQGIIRFISILMHDTFPTPVDCIILAWG